MGTVRVYLGLGSNMGDRESNLRSALELLAGQVALERTSPVYETEPWGYKEQPRFLNCVCEGTTTLDPRALLNLAKAIETALGRVPTFPQRPRAMDVDILFYGQRVIKEPGLEIPHARLAERAFVLVPLADIAAEWRHPVSKLRVADLLRRLAGQEADCILPEGVARWAAPIPVPVGKGTGLGGPGPIT